MSTILTSQPSAKGRPDDAREVLGRRLRSLREAKGLTPIEAGRHIGGSGSKISRIEWGRIKAKADDVYQLLFLYGVTDPHERKALLELARRLETRQWWDAYGDLLDGWFCSYLVLESIAQHIRTYEVRFVPGLLQTPAYAEAVIRLHHTDPDQVRRRVDVRMQRQHALLNNKTPQLWAVIDQAALAEAALPDGIAGPKVMRDQIAFLEKAIQHRNVNIQILRPGAGGRVGVATSFSLLRNKGLPDVAYLEHIGSAFFLDDPTVSEPYEITMSRLAVAAGRPEDTPQILTEALKAIGGE
ncbi:helix-turn-helix transcriptional regulator [Actinoplanes sp. NPDC048791]|uniref:helix-turn-helix domain-containing protein n=1 Tax=Actinoplanes sp. NPDC048791 TaxID=3154623 RepID=UPI0033F94A81